MHYFLRKHFWDTCSLILSRPTSVCSDVTTLEMYPDDTIWNLLPLLSPSFSFFIALIFGWNYFIDMIVYYLCLLTGCYLHQREDLVHFVHYCITRVFYCACHIVTFKNVRWMNEYSINWKQLRLYENCHINFCPIIAFCFIELSFIFLHIDLPSTLWVRKV